MTYDVQELIERCIICQEHGRSQPVIGTTQELPPFPWHTLATDYILLEENGLSHSR